jgi:hypothetical protein
MPLAQLIDTGLYRGVLAIILINIIAERGCPSPRVTGVALCGRHPVNYKETMMVSCGAFQRLAVSLAASRPFSMSDTP